MSAFFAYLHRLRFINRWSLMRNTVPENVAEHSFHVAVLTHALCTIGNTVYGKSLPTDRAVTLALFHDVTEVMTGDIATPVKHHNPGILEGLRAMESLAGEQLLGMLPTVLEPAYRPLLAGDDDAEARHYVKAADKLAAYLKCATEVAAGNREFAIAMQQLEEQVRQLHMPEVEYFLEHFATAFSRTLDEIAG